jgi:hypothetical protein
MPAWARASPLTATPAISPTLSKRGAPPAAVTFR